MSISMKKVQKKSKSDHSVFKKQENGKSNLNKQNSLAQDILNLHQTIGNQAVQRLYKTHTIQAKLTLSQPSDPYEKEADSMADKVMRMPENEDDKQEDILKTNANTLIQKKSDNNTNELPSDIESEIDSLKGKGEPLPKESKNFFESRFGENFSKVRIHHNSKANQLARKVHAKAFTKGYDIVFNRGAYNPESEEGKKLLAHELTHVRQQRGSVVQRVKKEEKQNYIETKDGILDLSQKQGVMHINQLPIPDFKFKRHYYPKIPFRLPPNKKEDGEKIERDTQQRSIWDKALKKNTKDINTKLNTILKNQIPKGTSRTKKARYYLKPKQVSNYYIIGTKSEIINKIIRPFWTQAGKFQFYQVDHKIEYQLQKDNADKIENLWLLDASSNMDSGRYIKDKKKAKINAILTYAKENKQRFQKPIPSYEKVRTENFKIMVSKITQGKKYKNVKTYTQKDIEDAKSLKGIKAASNQELITLRGSPNELVIFTTSFGGMSRKIPWDLTKKTKTNFNKKTKKTIGENFTITRIDYEHKKGGRIIGKAMKGNKFVKEAEMFFSITPSPIVEYGGIIPRRSIESEANKLIAEFLSPISFSKASFHPKIGLYAKGKISASLPIIKNASINIIIKGNHITLSKTFSNNDFKIPSPFKIHNSSLTISAGSRGLAIGGDVDFSIKNVGEGSLRGAKKSKGFELEGAFNFDSKLFKPAQIHMSYKDKVLEGGGKLGIPKGKIKGIKKALIIASYKKGNLNASGEVDLDIPGIDKGKMDLKTTNNGFSIGGEFSLKPDIPGIKSGKVKAKVTKKNDKYSVNVSGTAKPSIPGIDSDLSIDYIDGALTIHSKAKYKKGMLSGEMDVTVSNKKISKDGKPMQSTGKKFYIYGGGDLSLKLTPWLQATAGVKFLKNGELEVQGKIGLPSSVDLFKRKEIKRPLIKSKSIDIPIFAIPVGPKSIGIIARIGGGLTMKAGFGPGQLQALEATILYNPKHEEKTTLHGHGKFVIPADAGLELTAQLGLGASVVIASITGGIELVGTLGVKGAAIANVDVNWTPQQGIKLDAKGSIMVQPKFKFDINAYAKATLDLWIKEFSKTWRKNLKSFEWGPNIQFGLIFPIHYESKKPFDLSYKDIQIIYPNLNITNTAKGLALDVKKKIF